MAVRLGSRAGSTREENRAGGDVMTRKEEKEVKEVVGVEEVEEVEEKSAGVAAFFDLDGTLMCLPSLERRFFSMLRYRGLVGIRNCFSWLREAARLLPRGVGQIMHGNKMHLRGVHTEEVLSGAAIPVRRFADDLEVRRAEKIEERKRQTRLPVPLFAQAIERVAWHAEHGHLIVIVSGTLECLAEEAARELEARLGARDLAGTIRVCATRLETVDGRWTGRVVGEAMFGEAKARAIRGIAAEADLDLSRCFAYGDSASDKWMLECV
ncbi:MAG: HAD-IB family phosphatase, partial [Candidatus Acidiferrum sp.]